MRNIAYHRGFWLACSLSHLRLATCLGQRTHHSMGQH
jgi:hypothetical protein